jgi:hypothetical protein
MKTIPSLQLYKNRWRDLASVFVTPSWWEGKGEEIQVSF